MLPLNFTVKSFGTEHLLLQQIIKLFLAPNQLNIADLDSCHIFRYLKMLPPGFVEKTKWRQCILRVKQCIICLKFYWNKEKYSLFRVPYISLSPWVSLCTKSVLSATFNYYQWFHFGTKKILLLFFEASWSVFFF